MTATLEAPQDSALVATDVTFRIRRFQPGVDDEPHWEEYVVSMYPTDRVLTALERIKGEQDLDIAKPITVEAIKGLPLEKDLVVDMEPFFSAYRSVLPFLIPDGHEPTKERLQSAEDRARFDDTTKCILCAACTTSCPVYWTDGQYFGPQAIVAAHRFIFDSRDAAAETRLEILNEKEGVWRCRTTFNCTDACPRGIEVTKAIQEVKRALIFRRV